MIYGAAVVSALLAIMLTINVVGLIRALRGTIPRNSIVGFRTRATQRSDDSWAAGQRVGWSVRALLIPVYAIGLGLSVTMSVIGSNWNALVPIVASCAVLDILDSAVGIVLANRAGMR
jgi:Na+/glutamate symporter